MTIMKTKVDQGDICIAIAISMVLISVVSYHVFGI
jgi:hypothetical protein